jgi:hypothetical protein
MHCCWVGCYARTASCCTLIRYYDWQTCELIAAQPTEYEHNFLLSTGGPFTYKVLSVIMSMKMVLAQPNNDVEFLQIYLKPFSPRYR